MQIGSSSVTAALGRQDAALVQAPLVTPLLFDARLQLEALPLVIGAQPGIARMAVEPQKLTVAPRGLALAIANNLAADPSTPRAFRDNDPRHIKRAPLERVPPRRPARLERKERDRFVVLPNFIQ